MCWLRVWFAHVAVDDVKAAFGASVKVAAYAKHSSDEPPRQPLHGTRPHRRTDVKNVDVAAALWRAHSVPLLLHGTPTACSSGVLVHRAAHGAHTVFAGATRAVLERLARHACGAPLANSIDGGVARQRFSFAVAVLGWLASTLGSFLSWNVPSPPTPSLHVACFACRRTQSARLPPEFQLGTCSHSCIESARFDLDTLWCRRVRAIG